MQIPRAIPSLSPGLSIPSKRQWRLVELGRTSDAHLRPGIRIKLRFHFLAFGTFAGEQQGSESFVLALRLHPALRSEESPTRPPRAI